MTRAFLFNNEKIRGLWIRWDIYVALCFATLDSRNMEKKRKVHREELLNEVHYPKEVFVMKRLLSFLVISVMGEQP